MTQMRNFRYWTLMFVGLAITGVVVACSGPAEPTRGPLPTVVAASNPTPTPTMTLFEADDGAVQFTYHMAHNGSQQTGTLTLTQIGETTEMLIKLSPAARVPQPVTIRRGTCENPTGFVRDLDTVVGGVLRQNFQDMPIGEFAMGNMTVVVSPEFGSLRGVAACAEIPRLERPDLPGWEEMP